MAEGLTGRALALAAHPVCRVADADQHGLPIADLEAAVLAGGIVIGGKVPRQALVTALNSSQDLFEWVKPGRWRWIEPVEARGAGLSGRALAEEAYRLAILRDPDRKGLHYEALKKMLLDDGVIIRGTNPGRTLFGSLQTADRWFEWMSSGTFRWK